jgi:hypothetical protein
LGAAGATEAAVAGPDAAFFERQVFWELVVFADADLGALFGVPYH